MKRAGIYLILAGCAGQMFAQAQVKGDFHLALADHKGQLMWSVEGFKTIENSAKPNGREIGVRGRDASGQVTFLAFLFLAPESSPMTSVQCRETTIAQEAKGNATLKILRKSEIPQPGGMPVALAAHTTTNSDGSTTYRVRGFVTSGDICGDLEFYSTHPISDEDASLKKAFRT